jgi:hypothetical protein
VKKIIALFAAVLFLGTLCVPTLMADGFPDPGCKPGLCNPGGGGN